MVIAVQRASRRLPLRTLCFKEGLAAHWMLRRRGVPSILHYGIGKRDERLAAHVWVSVAGRTVIGAETAGDYVAVARFPAATESSASAE